MTAWAGRIAPFSAIFLLLLAISIHARPGRADPAPLYREAGSCAQLAPPGATWYEFAISQVQPGTFTTGSLTITLDVYEVDRRPVVDWQANQPLDAVYVAGGRGGNLYQYNPPGPAATSGSDLNPPLNPSGKNYHSPSALLICASSRFNPTASPTPLPTGTASPTPLLIATPPATPDPGETPTPELTLPPPPAGFVVFLSLAVAINGPGAEEPNDSCTAAYPIRPNQTYEFLADDLHDWFTFTLDAPATLTASITSFIPLDGQIAAYRGESCGATQTLANYGLPGTTKTLDLGLQPPGRYYLYVSNDGAFNDADPYQLTITATP
jgi:hypothetical protein